MRGGGGAGKVHPLPLADSVDHFDGVKGFRGISSPDPGCGIPRSLDPISVLAAVRAALINWRFLRFKINDRDTRSHNTLLL